MRRLLLALCLLLPLGLSAGAEPPSASEPAPPARDAVVPEGIEGLTPDEIHLEALFAALDGEVVRYERLLEVAAERGSLLAAKDLVRLHRVRGAPDWRETAMRTLRPIPRAEPVDWEQLYWLAYAGERLDPPLPQAQTDLWYRLAAWELTTFLSRPNRAYLQVRLAQFEEEQFLEEPVSERFRTLISEGLRLRRAGGEAIYRASHKVCNTNLDDAMLQCLAYLNEAASDGHVYAGYDYAVNILDKNSDLISQTTLGWAVQLLCRAADNDVEGARLRYAQEVLRHDIDAEYHYLRAYYFLRSLKTASPRAAELHHTLEERLTETQNQWLEDIETWGRSAPGC